MFVRLNFVLYIPLKQNVNMSFLVALKAIADMEKALAIKTSVPGDGYDVPQTHFRFRPSQITSFVSYEVKDVKPTST